MTKIFTTKFSITDRKAAFILTLCVIFFVLLALTQDILRAKMKNSSFYISESFIFSSFWWLFAPLLFTQYLLVKYKIKNNAEFLLVVIVLPIIIHLFSFPFLVWVISGIFYYHTFSFLQTFKYTLSEHLYLLVLLYTIPVLVFQFVIKKTQYVENIPETKNENNTIQYINTLIVTAVNKKTRIAVSEILYFSANPPYINIHLEGNKYLYNETLMSVLIKLNPELFVRVHKSTIVNIHMVDSYTTRFNGDYDLMMKNNVSLRVSRNYAGDFKNLFNKTHRLTLK